MSKPAVFRSPLNRVFTPVMTVNFQRLSSFTNPDRSRGLVIRTLKVPHFMRASVAVRQKTWYIGSGAIAMSLPSSRRGETQSLICSMLARMFPCVSIAPLEMPVVPPVYCRNATSSCRRGTGSRRVPAPRSIASGNGIAPSMRQGGTIFFTCLTAKLTAHRFGAESMSPTCVVTTCSTGAFRIAFCRVSAKFSRTTIAFAPESFICCSSSRAV